MHFTGIRVHKETAQTVFSSIDDVPRRYWTKLAESRIFFGHKSVGYNIIEGIKDLQNEFDYVKLNIVETDAASESERPIFAHAQVGKNTEPISKIEGFRSVMDAGAGDNIDIAFFKFCYVDVTRDSDPQEIFRNYSTVMEDLKARYPKTKFLHVTVPLKSVPKGTKKTLKESVKLLIGKPGILDDNLKRQHYNQLLKATYARSGAVFDLAELEAVGPDGLKCYGTKGSQRVSLMAQQYTDDGGHLNATGRKRIAEQLLVKLAEICMDL